MVMCSVCLQPLCKACIRMLEVAVDFATSVKLAAV